MRPFIERYPRFLRGSPEFRDLQQALEPELLELWESRDGALAQLCVETATWGLSYWERTLGLPVDEGAGIEARRGRVRARLLSVGVTTVATVQSVAESFFSGTVEVTEYAGDFLVEIRFFWESGPPPSLDDLTRALREIMPAHLGIAYEMLRNMASQKYLSLHGGQLMEISGSDIIHAGAGHYAALPGGVLVELYGGDALPGTMERYSILTGAEQVELEGNDIIPGAMARVSALSGGTMLEFHPGEGGAEGGAEL